jgi:hypothetical protein
VIRFWIKYNFFTMSSMSWSLFTLCFLSCYLSVIPNSYLILFILSLLNSESPKDTFFIHYSFFLFMHTRLHFCFFWNYWIYLCILFYLANTRPSFWSGNKCQLCRIWKVEILSHNWTEWDNVPKPLAHLFRLF